MHFNKEIPSELSKLIEAFAKRFIPSFLISIEQDIDFMQLLMDKKRKHFENKRLKLLLDTKNDGYDASTFHAKCNGHSPTICIIQSDHGNIFGAFTTIAWRSGSSDRAEDKEAFLFLIKSHNEQINKQCPKIYNVNSEGREAVIHQTKHGPTFGSGWDLMISDKCNEYHLMDKSADRVDGADNCHTYIGSNGYNHNNDLCGGFKKDWVSRQLFCVVNYQVFELC